jgi:hypothetical protein
MGEGEGLISRGWSAPPPQELELAAGVRMDMLSLCASVCGWFEIAAARGSLRCCGSAAPAVERPVRVMAEAQALVAGTWRRSWRGKLAAQQLLLLADWPV